LSFSSITQRASTPSGPTKVAGPEAALGRLGADLADGAWGVRCDGEVHPAMAMSSTIAIAARPAMTSFGTRNLHASPQTIYG
jgi:hypothetical protein